MNTHPTLPALREARTAACGASANRPSDTRLLGREGQVRGADKLRAQQGTPVQFRSRENWFRLPFCEPPERAGHSLRFGEVASVHARECLSVCDAHTHFAPLNKLCPFKQVKLLSCRPGPPALPATSHSQKPRDSLHLPPSVVG